MPTNRVAENVFGTIGTQVSRLMFSSSGFRDRHDMLDCPACSAGRCGNPIGKNRHRGCRNGLFFAGRFLEYLWASMRLFGTSTFPLLFSPSYSLSFVSSLGDSSTRPHYVSFIMGVAVMTVLGGFETGMVFALRLLLSLGLLAQYHEIYQRKEVVGVSILFMIVDCAGGVFSDLSLAFKPKFDTIAAIIYTLVIVMDAVVILAAIVLNPRARRRRRRLEEANSPGGAQNRSNRFPTTDSFRLFRTPERITESLEKP
ncbi:hypothetical protein MSAN_01061900 [Mycena sanguinolenta]|uniref:Uncharacterized protein n=1 Tax=Mycena sanguinolenta TaxID=230812 RepID=A0A8H7D925_9AGAR|nr:hypothetical protein MSAN_01061900 [Mycena sanguinolenta]